MKYQKIISPKKHFSLSFCLNKIKLKLNSNKDYILKTYISKNQLKL